MWTEHTPQNLVDGMIFPRMLALSEVLWTYPPQRNFDLFNQRVNAHYDRLKALNVDYGFPAVPLNIQSSILSPGKMVLTPVKGFEGVSISYQLHTNPEISFSTSEKFLPFKDALTIESPVRLICEASFKGKEYRDGLVRSFDPHKGVGKELKLEYLPSPYYTGGGKQALADGNIGSTNFRDGYWQAVQGENMEAMIDLGSMQEITTITTHWFHYGNAWIFRPSHVKYFISNDGVSWEELKDLETTISDQTAGEFIVPFTYSFEKRKTRFVKMIAINNGPCPDWHDAPGEPSWLFCDELIVR